MNSTPVTVFNLSGQAIVGDIPRLDRTRHRIVHMDEAQLRNCALLPPELDEQITAEDLACLSRTEIQVLEDMGFINPRNPFTPVREWIDEEICTTGTVPALATLLSVIDANGLSRSFDLHFWLQKRAQVRKYAR